MFFDVVFIKNLNYYEFYFVENCFGLGCFNKIYFLVFERLFLFELFFILIGNFLWFFYRIFKMKVYSNFWLIKL